MTVVSVTAGGKIALNADPLYLGAIQSKEPNRVNNNLLNHKREIEIWDFSLVPNTAQARYPSMAVGTDGVPHFAFANGTQYFSVATGMTPKNWEKSYTQYHVTAIDLGSDNTPYCIAHNGDVAGNSCGYSIFFPWDSTAGSVSQYSTVQTHKKCLSVSIMALFLIQRELKARV